VDIHGNIHGYIHGYTNGLPIACLWLTCKIPLRFHKAQQGVGRHIKTTMTQAFLSEIVIKMHKSK